jgi:hypothetical protein
LLSRENRRYILGTPKSLLKKFEQELHAGGWKVVHSGVEVKLCRSAFGNPKEVFILCRSTARRAKEKAIHDRFLRRLEAGFRRFEKSCEGGRLRTVKLPSDGWVVCWSGISGFPGFSPRPSAKKTAGCGSIGRRKSSGEPTSN